jgi:uncharacterized FlaG/YvyC family protein
MKQPNLKKENRSQLLKRSLTSIEKNIKTLLERLGIPLVFGYLHPSTKKVIFVMDSETNKHVETVDTLEKIETGIHASNTSEVPLEFVINSEKNV